MSNLRAVLTIAAAISALGATPARDSAGAAGAAERSFEATYDVHVRGMRAGELTLRFAQDGDAYRIASERRVTGSLRLLAGSSQDYRYFVRGAVARDGSLRPIEYRHTGGRKGRVVDVSFTPDGVVTTATPPMGMGEPPATPEQKRGAVDQLTAIAAMVTAVGPVCERTVPVFMDGRTRFDFVMRPDGREDVDSHAFRGSAVRCSVELRPIAGFTEPQERAELSFLFAPAPGGMNAPVRIEMPSADVGLVRLEARRLVVNGEPLR